MKRKVKGVIVAMMLLVLPTPAVYADNGVISFTAPSFDIPAITPGNTAISGVEQDFEVKDTRGTNTGWTYTLQTMGDFKMGTTDPSGSATMQVGFPSAAMYMKAAEPSESGGTESTFTRQDATLSTVPLTLLEAPQGEGAGSYSIPLNAYLTLPEQATVVTADTYATVQPGDQVTLPTGVYNSTFVYTRIAGI